MLRNAGNATDEILRTTDEMISVLEASPRSSAIRTDTTETASAVALTDDPSSHDYNRDLAVQYALDHWSETQAPYLYNPDYFKFPSTDCQNFVSQALYEGGNATMFIPNPQNPLVQGDAGWFYMNPQQYASGWTDVETFFVRTTKFGPDDPETWREIYNQGPEGTLLSERLGTDPYQVPAGLMKGDIIQFEWMQNPDPNGSLYDHTGIVVDIVGGEPYIAAHTVDHDSEPLSNFMPWEKIRFIHIERSNGYPPVKAKITQGSDDAGINPTGCAFSATNNEVYLGSCFSGGNIISGFRFNNIQIPQGAQIKYAYLTYTVDGTYTVPIDVQIYGEDAEDSATFSAGSPPSSRSTPYSPVLWNITDTWSLGLRRTTPQLSSVVQNIVNRSDWLPGYSLSIIVKNAGANVRRVIAIERSGFAPNFSPAKLIAAYEYSGPPISSLPFNSVGSQDGWVLESTENSGVGGSLDSNATSFRLGDDSSNRQYRGILHFDTANLPDTAVITSVILKIKQQGSIAGTNPFTTHGSLMVDIRQPSFDSAALQVGDFQAVAGQSGIATFDPAPVSSWYKAVLNNAAFPHINLTGTTQFRLYFTLDDNNDLGADYMAFSSGNNATAANRPQLLVVYYIP